TLISTTQIADANYSVQMTKGWCEIWSPDPSQLVAHIPKVNGLYCTATTVETSLVVMSHQLKMSLRHLHECMGHMSFDATRSMLSKGLVEGVEITSQPSNDYCETCIKAKITQIPFPTETTNHALRYGEWIHTDVWGPAQVQSLQGKLYYVSFTD
ncbi:hypothetical protein F5141DRAFT_984499, partial [Pisolithus sp. B1]